ncbi:hypothetical protein ACFWNJ_33860, partial [Streptomyces sp. NPDC058398]
MGRTASTQPEPASGAAEKPADDGASGPVEHAQAAPDAAAAEGARPKPASPERPANTPAVRPSAAQPTRSGGSSNRVRARLARLGVQRSNPYNPVLEPWGGGVRRQGPQEEYFDRPPVALSGPVAGRRVGGPAGARGAAAIP